MQKSFLERRRFPRLEKILPLKIEDTNFDIATQTKNISCAGAYCRVNDYIKPMTKLKVNLLLSQKTERGLSQKLIKCQGVVVRTDENEDKSYNIAIYFSEISNVAMQRISEYVNQHLQLQLNKKDTMADEVL